ncbi:glycogenin glucosyltransferase [Tulasnella sp. 418]|nr:glycogenin glucosyltransferase [Tulasnella sp. 418]
MGRHAYVTLLTSDEYLPGALTLAAAIRETHDGSNPPYIVCIATPHTLDVASLRELRRAFELVVAVEPLVHDGVGLDLLGRPDLHSVLTKLHVFRLTQFDKIIFLDADVLPVRSLASLFDLPHEFSAVPDVGWPDIFNSGVMVLTPGEDKFDQLINLVQSKGSWDGGDQGVLNEWRGPNWNRLSFTYNTTPTAAYTYAPAYERFGSTINAIHFIGANKPWSGLPWRGPRSNNQSTAPLSQPLPQQSYGYSDLVERWYDVYDRNYRPTGLPTQPLPPPQQVPAFQVPKYTNVWNLPVPRSSTRGTTRGGATMDLEQLKRLAIEGVNSAAVQGAEDGGKGTTPPRVRTPTPPGAWPESGPESGPGPGSGGTPSALIPVSSTTMGVGYVGATTSSFGGVRPEGKYVSMPLDGRVHLMSAHQLQSQAQQLGQPPPPSVPKPRTPSPPPHQFPPPVTATSEPPSYLFRPKPQYAAQSTSTSDEIPQQSFFRALPRRSPSPPRHHSSSPPRPDRGAVGSFRRLSREEDRPRSPEQQLGFRHEQAGQPEQYYQDLRAETVSPVRPPSPPMISWNPALEPPPDTLPSGALSQHVPQYYQNVWDLPRPRDHHPRQHQVPHQHEHPYAHHTKHEDSHKTHPSHHAHQYHHPTKHHRPLSHHFPSHTPHTPHFPHTPHTHHTPSQSFIQFPRSQHSPPLPQQQQQQQPTERPHARVHSYYSSSGAETPLPPATHFPRHHHHEFGRTSHHYTPSHPSQDHHIHDHHKPWHQPPQQITQPSHGAVMSGSTSPQDRPRQVSPRPPSQDFPSPRFDRTPEAFFTPPPQPHIPSRLIREGHYANVVSAGPGGDPMHPTPDPTKVHPVFPWESKPRRPPGRVFPKSSSPPPPSLIIPLVAPSPPTITIPETTVPETPETKVTEKERSLSPTSPVNEPLVLQPGQRRYHYDWRKHQSPPPKLSPGSGPFPDAMAYANAWDHVPSIQKYASKLVTPGSVLGFTSLGGGITPHIEDKGDWNERRDASDANSHDGDDEDDESDLDVVLSDGGGKKRGGKAVRSPPRSGRNSRRGSTAADRIMTSKGMNTEETYSSIGIVSVISSPSLLTLAPQVAPTTSSSKSKRRKHKGSRTASLETSPETKTLGLVSTMESAGVGPQPVGGYHGRQRSSQVYGSQGEEDDENRIPSGALSPRINEPQGFVPFRELSPHVTIKGTPTILTPSQGEVQPQFFSGPIPRYRSAATGADVPSHVRDSSYTSVGNRDSMFTATSNRDSIYTNATTVYGDQPQSPQLSPSSMAAKPPSSPQYALSSTFPQTTSAGGMPHLRTSSNETGLTLVTTSTTPPEPASPSEEPPIGRIGVVSPTGSTMSTPRRVSGRSWLSSLAAHVFKKLQAPSNTALEGSNSPNGMMQHDLQ